MVAVAAEEQLTLKEPTPERSETVHLSGTSIEGTHAPPPIQVEHAESVYVWLVAAVSEHAVNLT